MSAHEFVHLHTHTEYSLLDGASRIRDLVKETVAHGMKALAITDHGNMHGAIQFYELAREHDVKPILGCELYVSPTTRFDKETKEDRKPYHLTVLAKDHEGYQNLMRLVTIGHLEGYYSRPRIDKDVLRQHRKGLIILSGCPAGELQRAVRVQDDDKALAVAAEWRDLFGEDYYIEVGQHGLDIEAENMPALLRVARELSIPLVATNDSHYTHRHEASAQDTLLCILTGKRLDDPGRLRFQTEEFYLKSGSEMAAVFHDLPEAIQNTLVIAEKCHVELTLGKTHLPPFHVPEGKTSETYLEEMAWRGVLARYGASSRDALPPALTARVEQELSVICQMGYAPYFLIVQDFIQFARERGIQVGPGRGSAAGSIVAYALGITGVDPIRYRLLFERFLNPERISMPDIDIDFCFERRGEVIEYVTQKYGKDRVAQIITFGTMAARAVIRDVGRVKAVPLAKVDRIAKLVPNAIGMTIEKALEMNTELSGWAAREPEVAQLLEEAKSLEGLVRHASVHAAGVVISEHALTDYVPLQKMGEDQIVTQYSMDDLGKIGLLKMDFLGLRTLTLIDYVLHMLKKDRGIELDLATLPLDDKKTYDMLGRGDTMGIFQLESRGMRQVIRDLRPSRFEDVVALLALYRPGPLGSGMVSDFIERRHGRRRVAYALPALEPILAETYGVILYQEQVMEIASTLAGFSLGQADVLRRAMGKKKASEMAKLRAAFVDGAKVRKVPTRVAEEIFDLCAKFAEYGFNKSHSTSYAFISYQTAYLKAHYPREFMAALLTSILADSDKVSRYVQECRTMGVPVFPPDIEASDAHFRVEGEGVRYGLKAIKNIGEAAIVSILQARASGGPFASITGFCRRVDGRTVNKRVLENLIKSGAFDRLGYKCRVLLNRLPQLTALLAAKPTVKKHKAQSVLFHGMDALAAPPVAEENQFEQELSNPNHEEFSKGEKLKLEREALGFYLTGNPLEDHMALLSQAVSHQIIQVGQLREGTPVKIGGIVSGLRRITTKKKQLMLTATLQDLTAQINVVVFPSAYETCAASFQNDAILLIQGKVDFRNDELKIIVDEAKTLEGGVEKRSLHLQVEQISDTGMFSEIRDILLMNKGKEMVYLHVNGSQIVVGEAYRVKVSGELLAKLDELLGIGSVWVEH